MVENDTLWKIPEETPKNLLVESQDKLLGELRKELLKKS